jgi:pimeloyl-ACP methyl ester carboxylesterase
MINPNITIGHWTHGSGPTKVIVLPGWIGDSHTFQPVMSGVDETAFTVAFVDYRGYGLSRELCGPYNIDTIANDVLQLAKHLKWDAFHLVGHSMGGKVALKITTLAPTKISRILAITPVWAGRAPFDDQTKAVFRGAASDHSLREAIVRNTVSDQISTAWSRTLIRQSGITNLEAAFADYFESWAFDDFADAAARLRTPVKVLIGAQDRGVTEEATRSTWLQALPHAELMVMNGVGHYPMMETPPLFAGEFERYLGGPVS